MQPFHGNGTVPPYSNVHAGMHGGPNAHGGASLFRRNFEPQGQGGAQGRMYSNRGPPHYGHRQDGYRGSRGGGVRRRGGGRDGRGRAGYGSRGPVCTVWNSKGFCGSLEGSAKAEEELFKREVQHSTGINFDNYDNIPVEVSGPSVPQPLADFDEEVIGSELLRNLKACNFLKPTPVQRYSIPIGVAGHDLMACAQTGSGKTGAFLLPVLAALLQSGPCPLPANANPNDCAYPLALVLAPTRELCVQIYQESRKFCYRTGIRCVRIYGGAQQGEQLHELRQGADIIVATPGRLVDFMGRGRISLSRIAFLVLDEADRMLDMGFEPQIRAIVSDFDMKPPGIPWAQAVKHVAHSFALQSPPLSEPTSCLPKDESERERDAEDEAPNHETPPTVGLDIAEEADDERAPGHTAPVPSSASGMLPAGLDLRSVAWGRQTFMFSATFPSKIQQLSQEFMRPYVFLAVGRVGSTCSDVTQNFEWVEERQKLDRLWQELASMNMDAAMGSERQTTESSSLTLVFVETKRGADGLEMQLQSRGLRVCSIHGDKSQSQRETALKAFKQARIKCLVATDVASRGLDIPHVALVINYDLPSNLDDYVHRIGRTGRVGNVGRALSFFNERNYNIARPLKKLLAENNQELPPWLHQAAQRRGYGSGYGGSRGGYGHNHRQNKFDQRGTGRGRWASNDYAYQDAVGFGAYDVRQGYWNQGNASSQVQHTTGNEGLYTHVGVNQIAGHPGGYDIAEQDLRNISQGTIDAPSKGGAGILEGDPDTADSRTSSSRTESGSNPSSNSLSTCTDSSSSEMSQTRPGKSEWRPAPKTAALQNAAPNTGMLSAAPAQLVQMQYGYMSQEMIAQQQAALLQQMYLQQQHQQQQPYSIAVPHGYSVAGINLSPQQAQLYHGHPNPPHHHHRHHPQHQQQQQQQYHGSGYHAVQQGAAESYGPLPHNGTIPLSTPDQYGGEAAKTG